MCDIMCDILHILYTFKVLQGNPLHPDLQIDRGEERGTVFGVPRSNFTHTNR